VGDSSRRLTEDGGFLAMFQIKKYRSLDGHGKKVVDTVLDLELQKLAVK
jgi:hypothetical protein